MDHSKLYLEGFLYSIERILDIKFEDEFDRKRYEEIYNYLDLKPNFQSPFSNEWTYKLTELKNYEHLKPIKGQFQIDKNYIQEYKSQINIYLKEADLSKKLKRIYYFTYYKFFSIFDYMKIFGAISNSFLSLNDKAILLEGDINGIQKFIYNITNVEGFVKRLRGRSFFVSILPEIISKSILDSINYPIFNTIYVGGGKFQLLFNIKFLNEVVEKLNEINKVILESFSGGLGLTFAYVELMLDDFKNYKQKSMELFQKLEREKYRKFYKILNNVSLKIKDNDICPSCRIETKYYDEEFCDWCKKFEELGEKLLKGSFLVFSNNRGIGLKNVGYIDILENYPIDEDFYILNILSEALLDYGFKFINFIQEIKPFSELVEGEGYKKLAYLKIDVNKLGFKFSQVDSFFEVSRLSRFIDLFFSMYLKFIFEKYKNYIYVVYSGGDDLFLVGRWDKIIELAIEINKEFKEWTINDLSISASINLFDYNYPVRFAAEITSKNLDIAKEEGKEVFILNKFISFDELEDVYNDAKKKAEEYKGKISRSLIHRIYMMLKRKYLFFPMFYYQIYRNISDDFIREDFKSKIIDKKDMKIKESSEIFLELLLMKTREVKQ